MLIFSYSYTPIKMVVNEEERNGHEWERHFKDRKVETPFAGHIDIDSS